MTEFVCVMWAVFYDVCIRFRCGNVAAILELDENLNKQFRVFDAAPQVCKQCISTLMPFASVDIIHQVSCNGVFFF